MYPENDDVVDSLVTEMSEMKIEAISKFKRRNCKVLKENI